MAIQFFPKPGMVLICNFDTGFQPPEIVKKRRVIIISPHRMNTQLAVVVPISTTAPAETKVHHVLFGAGTYPFLHPDKPCWAKCDIIHTVALHRLDRLRVGGKYSSPSIHAHDLTLVRHAVMSTIGLTTGG